MQQDVLYHFLFADAAGLGGLRYQMVKKDEHMM
jgi:hypothetical protein